MPADFAPLRQGRKEPHAELAEVGDVDPPVAVKIEGGVVVRRLQECQREEADVEVSSQLRQLRIEQMPVRLACLFVHSQILADGVYSPNRLVRVALT